MDSDDFGCLIVVGVIVVAAAVIGGGIYAYNTYAEVEPSMMADVKRWVQECPELAPTVVKAMENGKMSPGEYKAIVKQRDQLSHDAAVKDLVDVAKKADVKQ